MVMASATGLSFLVTTFSRPLVPLLAQELGAGAARVGAVVAAYAVIPLVLAVPAGALVDRLGSRRLFVAGACGIVLGLGAIGLKPSIPVLFGAQALAGLSELLVIVAGQTYATSLSTGREREQHLGWYTTMVSAGQLVGPLLGGVLADAVGYARSFLTASVLGLLPVLVGTRVRDLPWASRQEPEKGATSLTMEREALGRILRTGGVQLAVVTSFATLFTMGVRQGFYPIYVEGLGYSAGFVGAMLSLRALASMSVRPFMPRIVRLMRGRFPTVFASMLVSAAGHPDHPLDPGPGQPGGGLGGRRHRAGAGATLEHAGRGRDGAPVRAGAGPGRPPDGEPPGSGDQPRPVRPGRGGGGD